MNQYKITVNGAKVAEISAQDAESAARAHSEACGPDSDLGFVRTVKSVDADTRGKKWAVVATDGGDITAEMVAKMNLIDYRTNKTIRTATVEEAAESVAAARNDGGAGVITVDGIPCYVA